MRARKRYRVWLLSAAVLFLGHPLAAREVWVVRVRTFFASDFPPCKPLVAWQSHLMFTNTTAQEQTVRVLAASNGSGLRPDARPLIVPPARTMSVRGPFPLDLHWEPAGRPDNEQLFWVNKIDLPDGVLIAARAESGVAEPVQVGPPCPTRNFLSAGLPLPVIRQLVPAGTPQYHLGVDVGDDLSTAFQSDVRLNVGIFNAAASAALVQVQVRCSDAVSSSRQVDPDQMLSKAFIAVPANTLVQQTVLPSTRSLRCTLSGGANPYHVIVTSDQPGFSYAVGLDNEQLPRFPANISVTH
jgi:hypothetical protein